MVDRRIRIQASILVAYLSGCLFVDAVSERYILGFGCSLRNKRVTCCMGVDVQASSFGQTTV